MFGKRKKKISVPHGQFKRRFTHKKKTFFGKMKLYDASMSTWIDANDLMLDYAMQQIIYQMPTSILSHPSESVSEFYVKNGYEAEKDFFESLPTSSLRKEQIASDMAYKAESEKSQSVTASEPARFGGFESASYGSSSSSDSGSSSYDSGSSSSSSSSSSSFDSGSF